MKNNQPLRARVFSNKFVGCISLYLEEAFSLKLELYSLNLGCIRDFLTSLYDREGDD